jgi:bla regulator protein blaR1
MIPDSMLPFANHVWQSTLFVIAMCVTAFMLRKNRAAVRHSLWLVASIKFLVPFSLLASIGSHFQWQQASVTPPPPVSMIFETISQPFSVSTLPVVPLRSTGPSSSTPAPQDASRLSATLIAVWISGVAASFFWWFMGWWQVRRAVRMATPADFIGPLRVMYGPERFEPGVFGIFRPVLLLPKGIANRLSPAQLQAVLAHELCHVRHRDNLTMAIHMTVEALFWFHPFLWWIKSRLIDEQERACDEEVIRLGSEPMVYAESLLKVCEFYVELPLTCVSGVTGSDLKERVGRIMRNQIGETLNRWTKVALVTIGIAALATPIVAGMVSASTFQSQTSPNQIRPQASRVAVIEGEVRPEGVSGSSRAEEHVTLLQQSAPEVQVAQLQPPVAFEVASVRIRTMDSVPVPPAIQYLPGGRFVARAVPLRALIQEAYNSQLINIAAEVRASNESMQVLARTPFDVEAVAGKDAVPPYATAQVRNEKIRLMLQTLLFDRFKLVVHRETAENPVYAIVIGNNGHRLLKAAIEETECVQRPFVRFPPDGKSCHSVQADPRTGIHGEAVAVADIAKLIWYRDRPIVDRTGLSALYNIQTNGWTVDVGPLPPDATEFQKAEFAEFADPSRPTLLSVFGGLGLRLEAQTAPVEVIEIRHIERPSEN